MRFAEGDAMIRHEDLRTVRQIAEANPGAWTEASLRWLLFNRNENGLDRAVVKVGRKILIDIVEFEKWLEEQRLGSFQGPVALKSAS